MCLPLLIEKNDGPIEPILRPRRTHYRCSHLRHAHASAWLRLARLRRGIGEGDSARRLSDEGWGRPLMHVADLGTAGGERGRWGKEGVK